MALWDLSDYYPSGKFVNVGASYRIGGAPFFKGDGTKVYFADGTNELVVEYALSTAWDVSTATFSASFSVLSEETNPLSVYIGDNGTKMYVLGTSSDAIIQYALSTAWDVSSASLTQSQSISAQDGASTGLYFKDDGTKAFIIGATNDDIFEYTLSTAWDVSTLSFVDSFDFSGKVTTNPRGPAFGNGGTKFYITGTASDQIHQYNMSTAWDVSTATFNQSIDVPVSLQDGRGIFFRSNGNNFYLNSNTLSVYQYNLSNPITAAATMAGTSTFAGAALQPITAAATMAGTSTFDALPANVSATATMAGVGALSGAGSFATATKGRAVDEASAGGTDAALSVSLNNAITEPANPSRNT
jgi:hypothetical protein